MRILTLLFVSIFVIDSAHAQRSKDTKLDDYYVRKNELGINITNLLGNVLSLNPNNVNSPYFLTYRRHFKKTSLRLGMNYDLDQSEQFEFVSNESINKKVKATTIDARIGIEWHYPISKRFMMSAGVDGIFSQFEDDSEIVTTNFTSSGGGSQSFRSLEVSNGFGGGPFIRFDFKFNDIISLSTESTFYYLRTSDNDSLFGQTGQLLTENKATRNKAELVLPQALFVNISF